MRYKIMFASVAVILIATSVVLAETMPFIVDPPRVSKTAFFNWDRIEVVYPVRYLDGYKPNLGMLEADKMSFSPFETEGKLRIERKQKIRKENYMDFVYILRYVGPKKGKIVIPKQKFSYVKLEAGKREEDLKIEEFETEEIVLNFLSTLEPEANDITDEINFDSFKFKAYLWMAISGLGLLASFIICLLMLFRKPRQAIISRDDQPMEPEPDTEEGILIFHPTDAVKWLNAQLKSLEDLTDQFYLISHNRDQVRNIESRIYNIIRVFLLSHVQELTAAHTAKEILGIVGKLNFQRDGGIFLSLAERLKKYEKSINSPVSLIFSENSESLSKEIDELRKISNEFKWHRKIRRGFYFKIHSFFRKHR